MRYTILALPLMLAACATTDPDQRLVTITTATNGQQFDGANCAVTTRSASWNIVTPATLKIDSDNGLRIICNKPGYRTSELILPPYDPVSGSSVGIGMGGGNSNVGMGMGFSFPLATGGGHYPAQITVNMNPL
jgi:hypothetical protein